MTPSKLPAPPRIDDFERLLFESARADAVPGASRQRVALALGIPPGVPLGDAREPQLPREARTGNTGDPEAASTALSEASKGAGKLAAPGKPALLGKLALLGLAGGAVALGLARWGGSARESSPVVRESRTEPRLEASARSAGHDPSQALRSAGTPLTRAVDHEPTLAATVPHATAPVPLPSRTPARPPSKRVAKPEPPGSGSRLLAEVRRLDAARDALAAGHATLALAELEAYEGEFPAGTLAEDAALLEVRALDRSGQRAAAHQRARALLSRPGADRHRAELEGIVNPLASGSKAARRDIEGAR